eukprot:45575-Rhodomonas_salina.2
MRRTWRRRADLGGRNVGGPRRGAPTQTRIGCDMRIERGVLKLEQGEAATMAAARPRHGLSASTIATSSCGTLRRRARVPRVQVQFTASGQRLLILRLEWATTTPPRAQDIANV